MRRSDIQKSVDNLQQALSRSGVISLFGSLIHHHIASNVSTILQVYQNFAIEYVKLSPTEKQILAIFELNNLIEPEFWEDIIQPSDEGHYGIAQITDDKILRLVNFLPQVLELFKQDYIDFISKEEANRPVDFQNKEILTIILPEEGDHFSSPLRLSEIINGIIQLYQACAFFTDQSPDDLVVLAIDSGSDKSFDFLGAAATIKCLKELITEIWDRIVFNKYKVAGERIQLVTTQLSALERINQSERDGNIGREQAEILRRKITEGTEKFMETGAITPELDNKSYNNPRKLMAPEPKMLVEKTPSTQAEEKINPAPEKPAATSPAGLSPDQLAQLLEYMNKMNKANDGDQKKAEDDTEEGPLQ